MRFLFFTSFLLLASCASGPQRFKGVTFEELESQLSESLDKKISCGEFSQYKFVTKLEFVICLSKLTSSKKQSVQLDYNDLPKSGPIVDHVFHLLTLGAVRAKAQFIFGSNEFIQKDEISTALAVLK